MLASVIPQLVYQANTVKKIPINDSISMLLCLGLCGNETHKVCLLLFRALCLKLYFVYLKVFTVIHDVFSRINEHTDISMK